MALIDSIDKPGLSSADSTQALPVAGAPFQVNLGILFIHIQVVHLFWHGCLMSGQGF